jgi:hypothetical protein
MKRKTAILLISIVVLFSACTNSKGKKASEEAANTSSSPATTQTPKVTSTPQPTKSPQVTKTPEATKGPEASKVPTVTASPGTNSSTGKAAMTRAQAESLVKDYLKKKGEYVPALVVVDSEDEKTFTVHCYDVIGKGTAEQHTATSGWYTVTKSTGEVKSML